MKKYTLLAVLLSSFILFSCDNFAVPSGVKVKTEADYKFTIADIDLDLSQYFSAEQLSSNLSSGAEGMSIYNYNPNGAADKFELLMDMQLQEIPLDFSSYLESIDLSSSLSNMSIGTSVTIPDVNEEFSQDISLSDINSMINALVSFKGQSGAGSLSFLMEDGCDFDYIEYSSGSLTVSGTFQNGTTVTLTLKDGTKLTGTFKNGTTKITIPDGTKLHKSGMSISFSDSDGIDYYAIIDSSSQVKKTSGLTLSDTISKDINTTFLIPASDALVSCTIGSGTLTSQVETPEGWSGVSASISGNITGGLDLSFTDGSNSLAGKVLEPKDISLAGSFSVSFNNATITFTDGNPDIKLAVKIDSFSSAKISLGESYSASQSFDYELPEEATTMIDYIIWKPSGISISCTTSLPAGNDIKMENVVSSFLGINDTDAKSVSNKTVDYLSTDKNEELGTDYHKSVITSGTKVDFSADLLLPGYDDTDKTLTLTSVECGKDYSIDLNIQPVFEWFKIAIDPSALASAPQTGNIETGFDLSSIFSSVDSLLFTEEQINNGDAFSGNIKIKSLPVYIFCQLPSVLSGAKFTGTIYASTGSSPTYLLGSSTEDGTLASSTRPVLEFNEANEVITNIASFDVTSTDFASLINGATSGSSLDVDYSLAFSAENMSPIVLVNPTYQSDPDVSAEDTALTDGSSNISLSAMLVLPFDFTVENNLTIDALNLYSGLDRTDPNWDLLNRSEAPSNETLDKFLGVIDNVSLTYNLRKKPFGSDSPIRFAIKIPETDDAGNFTGDYILDDSFKLSSDTISLDPADLMKTYPLQPSLNINIPKGNLYIPSKVGLATNVVVGIKTDGTLPLNFQ